MRSLLISTGTFLCGITLACADETANNTNLWLNYVGDHPLFGSRWGVHLEVQNRLSDWGDDWQQLLVRPGINYRWSDQLSASVGWAFVRTYPYGDLPVAEAFDEHRIWEQVLFKHTWLDLEWQHRLRLEQRWIEENSGTNWRGENRIRYLLRTTIPVTQDKKVYVVLWDELFFNFGGNVDANEFDQNRAFIGIGWKLSDSLRLEAGFMEQTLHRRGGELWENNHTPCVWLSSNLPFGK
jgi:hypothetical protein